MVQTSDDGGIADRKRNAWGVSEQKAAISVQVSVWIGT